MSISANQTSLKQGLLNVLNNNSIKEKPINKDYSFILHANEFDYELKYVDTFQINRDYISNLGDFIYVNVKIPLGDFIHYIYPALTSLEMTIKVRTYVDGKEKIKKIDKFRVIVNNDLLKKYRTSYVDRIDHQTLNNSSIEEIQFTLIDRSLEALRVKTTQGTLKNKKVEDIIRGILVNEINKVKIEGKACIDGIDIHPSNNLVPLPQFVVGSGLHVLNVPTYLQEKISGVYSSGLGTYIQKYNDKKFIFVYPLYDTDRWDKELGDRLQIYSLPERDLPIVELTYNKKEKTLYILTTGNKEFMNSLDTSLVSKGAGIRAAKSESIITKPIVITSQGPVAVRDKLNYNVAGKALDDYNTYVNTLSKGSVSNPFKNYSDILKEMSNTLLLNWQNADIEQIYPGMPVSVSYIKSDKVVNIKGIVGGVHFSVMRVGNTYTNSQFNTSAKLMIITGELPK